MAKMKKLKNIVINNKLLITISGFVIIKLLLYAFLGIKLLDLA